MNLFDSIISALNPAAGLARLRSRYGIRMIEEQLRKYDAASHGRRTKGWFTPSTSANAEVEVSITSIRNRSRDLVRNNPYAARGIEAIAANVVGTGIQASIKVGGRGKADRYKALWKAWAETTACDILGRMNLYQMQAQIMRAVAESGEVIVLRRWVNDGSAIPMKLQVLEGDFIDPHIQVDNWKQQGPSVHYGVEVDENGKVVKYYLYKQHPGDAFTTLDSRPVDATEVLHIYRADRPGQIRGVPWLAPVMIRLKDYDEFQDAELLRQKIAASFAAFVTDANGIGTNKKEAEDFGRIQPGTIEFLPPGRGIEFANPPVKEGFDVFSRTVLHAIASGLGITYEVLTGDLTGVNFSSGRMGFLEFHRNIESWQWNLMVPMFCQPAFEWFVQAGKVSGAIPMSAQLTAEWTAPRREMIDPDKETRGLLTAMKSGLKSWPDTVREMGYDPDEVLEQIKDAMAKMDETGFIAEWDLRHNVNRSAQAGGGGNGGGEGDGQQANS